MAKFCVYCGKEVEENDNVCGNCGKAINNNVQTVVTVKEKSKTDGLAVAGFILSIVSFLCYGSTSTLGLIFSIIGLVNCNKNGKDGKGLAIAGIIINSIMFIVFIVLYVIMFIFGYAAELY